MSQTPEAELEALLSESEHDAGMRAASAFDAQAGPVANRIVLFGAGNLGRIALGRLRALGIPPLCFSDNDSRKWGTTVDGLPVLNPTDAAKRYGTSAVAVMTIWGGERQQSFSMRAAALRSAGFERVVHCGFLFWKYAAAFLPWYAMDLPQGVLAARDQVRRAFAVWGDDASRREYVAQVRWRLSLDFDGLPPPSRTKSTSRQTFSRREPTSDLWTAAPTMETRYAPSFDARAAHVLPSPHGSPTRSRAHGSKAGWPRYRRRCARGSPCRATPPGAEPGDVLFTSSGTPASVVGRGSERIHVVSLDDAIADFAPTFIKMDIEGADLDTLKGARNVIATNRPVMAACTYHMQHHLWEISLALARNEQYTFALRPHLPEVWELVTYVVPDERLHE